MMLNSQGKRAVIGEAVYGDPNRNFNGQFIVGYLVGYKKENGFPVVKFVEEKWEGERFNGCKTHFVSW